MRGIACADRARNNRGKYMRISGPVLCFTAGAAALAIAAGPALAAHGKAGLWNVTVTTDLGGMALPDMSRLPPEAQAAMRANGVTMNGNTMSVQHCMMQAEVDASGPPPMRNLKECAMSNAKMGVNSFSADMTCHGQMNGTGHVEVSYDSPEHYLGKSTITGTVQGHPMSNTTTFEGHWVSADCKGVTH
jgi:hypothetical protein